jgi:hypothetical protein
MGSIMSDIMKVAQLAMDVATQNWVAVAEDVFKDIAQLTGNKTLEEIAAALPPVGLLESPMMSGLMGNMGLPSFNAMNSSISGAIGASSPLSSAMSFGTNSPLSYLQTGAQGIGYAGTLSGNTNMSQLGMLGVAASSNPLLMNALSNQSSSSLFAGPGGLYSAPPTGDGVNTPVFGSINTNGPSLFGNSGTPTLTPGPQADGSFVVASTPTVLSSSPSYGDGVNSPVFGSINTNGPSLFGNSGAAAAAASANTGLLTPGPQADGSFVVATTPSTNSVINQGISNGAFSTQLTPSQLQMLQLAAGGSTNIAPTYASALNGMPSYLQSAPTWQQSLYQVGSVLGAYGQTLPGFSSRLASMQTQGSYISQGINSGSYAIPTYANYASPTSANPYGTPTLVAGQGMSSGGYVTPTVSNYTPSITAQYGGTNSVINQGVANGAFSTALTPDQQNMLSQAQAAGASGPQLAMMQLQMQMENQQEVLQAISKIFNMLDQTAKAIIQNM